MAKEIKLEAVIRKDENGGAKKIRQAGFVPAVLYGSNIKTQHLKIKRLDLEKIYEIAGESSLIDLVVGRDAPSKVLVKDVQKDIVRGNLIHVDLYRVDMNRKITTEIPLNFIGESRAVKELNAMLMKNINEVEVECLPGDLISQIDVSLEPLNNFNDAIRVKDLKKPEGLEILNDENDTIISAVEPRVVEEETAEEPSEDLPAQAGEGEEDVEEKGDKAEDDKAK